jgi:formate--tetrahydrofolate ligase
MPSDLEIAHSVPLRPITMVAAESGILPDELISYGRYKGKVSLRILERLADRADGRYVAVTAVTPSPMGEGKTVTTIGLGQALAKLGASAFTTIRQPSLGPVFGIKGGGTGGGRAQVVPMEDVNLHLTGDTHAVSAAHNLCAAILDNELYHGRDCVLDPQAVYWKRVVDVSDRALRDVVTGLGGRPGGIPRETGFEISVASELMAILALSEDLADLRSRIGRIVLGLTREGRPVTTGDIGAAGAMAVLMRDTIMPNLVQNLEGGPVFVHAGPFANIAHGNSSVVADRIALKLADYVVTESGFGADMGFEKLVDIKCRTSGLAPDCAVVVATVRALKIHAGHFDVRPGRPLPPELEREDLKALAQGMVNLERHIETVLGFGVPAVVAINAFPTDTAAEHELVRKAALAAGASDAVVHRAHAAGGAGAEDLARAVMAACEEPSSLRFAYEDDDPVVVKIEKIATRVYGAEGVDLAPVAQRAIGRWAGLGYGRLPVCMAKTPLSVSHDPALKGRPRMWRLPVRDVELDAGAGFLVVLAGDIMTMPGLPSHPAAARIDIDENGNVVGLS